MIVDSGSAIVHYEYKSTRSNFPGLVLTTNWTNPKYHCYTNQNPELYSFLLSFSVEFFYLDEYIKWTYQVTELQPQRQNILIYFTGFQTWIPSIMTKMLRLSEISSPKIILWAPSPFVCKVISTSPELNLKNHHNITISPQTRRISILLWT